MHALKRHFSLAMILLFLSLFLSGLVSAVNSQTTQGFILPCTIQTYGNAWEGEFVFGLWKTNPTTESYLVVMNTNGSVEYFRYTNQLSYFVAKNFAQDTILFMGEPYVGGANAAPLLATHIWNYVTNATSDSPNVVSHHDIEYNPVNNTFLALGNYVRVINGTSILFDKILEVDATGAILWSWDTFDHIPLSDGDPFNPQADLNGVTVEDFTHANAIDWDYNNSIIYLNLRHTNTFYKINQNTGNVVWACGEHGNFTLLGDNGTAVKSLWYHSHGTKQIATNVFEMFDNDFANETNPNDCHSRMIEVEVNEQDMTASVIWSWEDESTQYYTPYLGDTTLLPNGDRIGAFGTATHQFSQNQPWNFSDTGAVFVEVNETGSVVRTYTFPPGWFVYRLQEIQYPSSVVLTNPPSIPEFSSPIVLLVLPIVISGNLFFLKLKYRKPQ